MGSASALCMWMAVVYTSVCRAHSNGISTCLWCMNWIFGTYSPCRDVSPRLDAGEGAWSCLRVIRHALLTPMGGLPLFEWRSVWGGRQEVGEEMGRWEEKI